MLNLIYEYEIACALKEIARAVEEALIYKEWSHKE